MDRVSQSGDPRPPSRVGADPQGARPRSRRHPPTSAARPGRGPRSASVGPTLQAHPRRPAPHAGRSAAAAPAAHRQLRNRRHDQHTRRDDGPGPHPLHARRQRFQAGSRSCGRLLTRGVWRRAMAGGEGTSHGQARREGGVGQGRVTLNASCRFEATPFQLDESGVRGEAIWFQSVRATRAGRRLHKPVSRVAGSPLIARRTWRSGSGSSTS